MQGDLLLFNFQKRDCSDLIPIVDVVVVEVPVVAVEIPSVVHVVPLSEPTVRAGRVDIRSSAVNDSRHPFYYIHN